MARNVEEILTAEEPELFAVEKNGARVVQVAWSSRVEKHCPGEGEDGTLVWEHDEVVAAGLSIADRAALVAALMRLRYSLDDELATLRQRDSKPDEFAVYDAFAESAKAFARTIFPQS